MTANQGDLQVLYQENTKVAMVFWEWRHKLLAYSLSSLAGVAVLASWLYEHAHRSTWIAFLLGSFLCLLALGIEIRTQHILSGTYECGKHLELQLAPGKDLVFTRLADAYASDGRRSSSAHRTFRRVTYGRVFVVLFSGMFVALFITTWALFLHPPAPAP